MTTIFTNLHQQILNEFQNSNIKIKSLDRLNEYITYCIDNNQNEPTKFKTSLHHILPKAKDCFPQYKDLKANKWNSTHLYHKDHYYAHWLLTEAISNYSQLNAFCAMHKKDFKKGRINEYDLIPAKEFQEKMVLKGNEHSKYQNNINNESGLTNAQINVRKGVEIRKKIVNLETGLSSYQESGKKISKHQMSINPETGLTYGAERSAKAAVTMSKINPETGLTIRQEADIKRRATLKRNKELKNLS